MCEKVCRRSNRTVGGSALRNQLVRSVSQLCGPAKGVRPALQHWRRSAYSPLEAAAGTTMRIDVPAHDSEPHLPIRVHGDLWLRGMQMLDPMFLFGLGVGLVIGSSATAIAFLILKS
jgi:hypothetical protein